MCCLLIVNCKSHVDIFTTKYLMIIYCNEYFNSSFHKIDGFWSKDMFVSYALHCLPV